jgi:hypothetical protein
MLCTLIVVWLGLWGPLLDLEKLRDCQPLMASIVAPTIALGAATLAYHSAMAKVYHDREEAERRRNSERLGLFPATPRVLVARLDRHTEMHFRR